MLTAKIAKIISYTFDGSFISVPFFIAICLVLFDNAIEVTLWAFFCILFTTIIPNTYILILYKKKLINDLHVPIRQERLKPLIVGNISYILGFFIMYTIRGPLFLRTILFTYMVTILILTVITYFWKISFHTSWITFAAITFFVLFGKWLLLLLLLIPLVGWARIKIKRHTLTQVILGSTISSITTLFGYSFFGFLRF